MLCPFEATLLTCCSVFYSIRGAYFQVGDEVKMGMTVADAYRRSIQTLSDWLRKEVNTSKTHVIYRTYAPVHFRSV
jgi:hypothetical protein